MADDSESPLAVRKSKRSTAGNRMRELIEMERKHLLNNDILTDTFEGLSSFAASTSTSTLITMTNNEATITSSISSNGSNSSNSRRSSNSVQAVNLSSNSSNNIVEDVDSEYYTESEEDVDADSDSSTEKYSDSSEADDEEDGNTPRKKVHKRPNTRARTQSVPVNSGSIGTTVDIFRGSTRGSSCSNEKPSRRDKEKNNGSPPMEGEIIF